MDHCLVIYGGVFWGVFFCFLFVVLATTMILLNHVRIVLLPKVNDVVGLQ